MDAVLPSSQMIFFYNAIMFQEHLPLHPCVQCEQALPQEGCGNTWKKYLTEGNIKRIFFFQTIVGPCDSNVAFARLAVARSRLKKQLFGD